MATVNTKNHDSKKISAEEKKRAAKEKKLAAEIARRSKLFKAASKEEKRVLIAKDVIAQIRANRYLVRTGTWAELYNKTGTNLFNRFLQTESRVSYPLDAPSDKRPEKDAQVQSLFLDGTVATCECCALGGIMMSCTLYNNNQTLHDFCDNDSHVGDVVNDKEKFANGLHRIFSRQQLALIECAFEGGKGGFSAVLDDYFDDEEDFFTVDPLLANLPRETLTRAVSYADKYPVPENRMIAIMRNIIKNNGTFKP